MRKRSVLTVVLALGCAPATQTITVPPSSHGTTNASAPHQAEIYAVVYPRPAKTALERLANHMRRIFHRAALLRQ